MAQTERARQAWTTLVGEHREAEFTWSDAANIVSSQGGERAVEAAALAHLRYVVLTRMLIRLRRILVSPGAMAWSTELDGLVLRQVDMIAARRRSTSELQSVASELPIDFFDLISTADRAKRAIAGLEAAPDDRREYRKAVADLKLAAAAYHRWDRAVADLAEAITEREATELRTTPVDITETLNRAAETPLRLVVGIGLRLRPARSGEVLVDNDETSRPDLIADTESLSALPDEIFHEAHCDTSYPASSVTVAGLSEIHRVLRSGGTLTVTVADQDPTETAAILEQCGFIAVTVDHLDSAIEYPPGYSLMTVTAGKSGLLGVGVTGHATAPAARSQPARPRPANSKTIRSQGFPRPAADLTGLVIHRDPSHPSGFVERTAQQLVERPERAAEIVAELRKALYKYYQRYGDRWSPDTIDWEVNRWLRQAVGSTLRTFAFGRLAKSVIDRRQAHGTTLPDSSDDFNAELGLSDQGPGTRFVRSGRAWLHREGAALWDEIVGQADHPLRPLVEQFGTITWDEHAAGQKSFFDRQRTLASGQLRGAARRKVTPPANYYVNVRTQWLGSSETNWEFVASLLIGHAIMLENRLGRTPALDEFAASVGEALRRPLVLSTSISSANIDFTADPIALSLERWENTPHHRDRPYAIAANSESYRIATEDSPRAGGSGPSLKGGRCHAAVTLMLPAGPERDAIRDLFHTNGIRLPDDESVTVLAGFVIFGFNLAMETLFPGWPGVTVQPEPSLAEFRRLDATGIARQLGPGPTVLDIMDRVISPDWRCEATTAVVDQPSKPSRSTDPHERALRPDSGPPQVSSRS